MAVVEKVKLIMWANSDGGLHLFFSPVLLVLAMLDRVFALKLVVVSYFPS